MFWVIQVQITLLFSLRTHYINIRLSYSTLEPTSYITCGKAAKIQLVSATYKRFTIVFAHYVCTCKHDDEMYHRFFVYFFFTELYIRNFTRVMQCRATMLATDINIKD